MSFRGLDAAIEVKRLGSRAGVQASVSDGVDQCCEFGDVSALALDLTDCVALPSSVLEGSSDELEAQATVRFEEIQLRNRIVQGFTELGASDLQPRPVRPRLRFT